MTSFGLFPQTVQPRHKASEFNSVRLRRMPDLYLSGRLNSGRAVIHSVKNRMLTSGTRLGTFEITSHIGSGGMGDVYQAHDSKLDRDVAIKVLPEQFARDSERLARFQREAKLLAALNHPNIAAIYGLEQSGNTHYLVMELVPGETLRDRTAGERPVPIEEALAIAKQIAEALEAAHGSEKTIIHRDLKPANVKVTPEGRVKVLDFGLAKAFAAEPSTEDMANSPTLSALPTMHGAIIGTAAYMSPEQARGKAVTKATDIWAFGAVLYELLTGKQAFPGEDITEILAAVVKSEPDWKQLPENTPPAIHTLLRRCLRKERRQRLQDAASLRIEIEDALKWIADGGLQAAMPMAVAPRRKLRERVAWAAAALLLVFSALLAFLHFRETPPEQPATRLSVLPQNNVTLASPPVVSPDGRKLAFVGRDTNGQSTLWIRLMDALVPQPLPGTSGAGESIFWSPDSRFLAFFAEGKLKKIDITGGPPVALCDSPNLVGGTWSKDGIILFARANNTGLSRVAAAGGSATPLTTPDPSQQETAHRYPSFLPDGDHFLFRVSSGQADRTGIYLGSLNSPEKRFLFAASSNAQYVPLGYVLFLRDGTLMAQQFDARKLQASGEAFPIGEQVPQSGLALASFSASENGALAYASGSNSLTHYVWVDRAGREVKVASEPAQGGAHFTLSPDEKRVALEPGGDVWLLDLTRGTNSRFTFDPAIDSVPIWSPDGNRLVFASRRGGKLALYQKTSTGGGQDELLAPLSGALNTNIGPTDWSRDGQFILSEQLSDKTKYDLVVVPLSGDRKPMPFLQSEFDEGHARFSPDGRWVAYTSNESGRPEVYVQPFPASGGKWQVSTGGGILPMWRGDGRELFYVVPTVGRLMSVDVKTTLQFEASVPKLLFTAALALTHGMEAGNHYGVSADGQRFLLLLPVQENTPSPITVVLNWTAGLQK